MAGGTLLRMPKWGLAFSSFPSRDRQVGRARSQAVGVIVLFMAALALYAGWWLSHQRLMAKPWLEEGGIGEFPGGRLSAPPAKIGLGVFLAVAGSLFALVISAYVV